MRKQICYMVSLLTFALALGAGNCQAAWGAILEGAAAATPSQAAYLDAPDRSSSWESLLEKSSFSVTAKPSAERETAGLMRMAKSSRASNVLTITGSGNHEMMQSVLGKPGVYLLFQGANFRPGYNKMISDHTINGAARQLDAIWEYYKMNDTKTITSPRTEIWTGSGSYGNAEEVLVADSITITNSTDNETGNWSTTVQITNPHPKLTGVVFFYYAPYLQDYGGVTIFPITEQTAVTGAKEAHVHKGVSRTEPTCTAQGMISGICEMCGTVSESIPALGHSVPAAYDSASVPGYRIKNCLRCRQRLETVPNTYQVVYEGNGATQGATQASGQQVGTGFRLAANGFSRTGYRFGSWNTQPDGGGTAYQAEQTVQDLTLDHGAVFRLYAQWIPNTYTITFDPSGGSCKEEQRQVTYGQPYGQLPEPAKTDYQFLGWMAEGSDQMVSAQTIYENAWDTALKASWKLRFEDMGNGTNRRPGEDGNFGSSDDHYWYNGLDGKAGTEDDIPLLPGADGEYGTGDDWYQNPGGSQIHAGLDKRFDTLDDYIDNGDGTNTRPGEDGTWGTEDDEKWENGEDALPGTEDDRKIQPGLDGEYGTGDDFIDNGDGTNTRPGEDGAWGTEDDEKWENGEDALPGTEDDRKIQPGLDGEYGTGDDFIDNGDGTNTRPGEDGTWGTEDDEKWENGEDGQPGTPDDKKIIPGEKEPENEESKGENGGQTQPGIENPPDGGSSAGTETGKGDSDTSSAPSSSSGSSSAGGSSGGSGWSTGGSSSGGSSGAGGPGTSGSYVSLLGNGKTGEWKKLPEGWIFCYDDGSRAKSTWDYLYYGITGRTDWYRFGEDEYMKTGWYQDTDGAWYFLHTISDGTLGHMKTGWYLDGDGRWYYLNPVSDGHRGAMATDWRFIDGKWYYFNPVSDGTKGAMYADCRTPDGYLVGKDGAWIEMPEK